MEQRPSQSARWPVVVSLGVAAIAAVSMLAYMFNSDDEPSLPAAGLTSTVEVMTAIPVAIQRGGCASIEPEGSLQLQQLALQPGDESASLTYVSRDQVNLSIADLLAEPHSIVIASGDDAPEVGIALACGPITGGPQASTIVVGLLSNQFGDLAGVGVLSDLGREGTAVEVYLVLSADRTAVGQDDLLDGAVDMPEGEDGEHESSDPESSDL